MACALLGAVLLPARAAAAAVWVIDDGEKIGRDETSLPFKTGKENPIWAPGKPIRLFGLRDEVVAFQVVIEADAGPVAGVDVDVVFDGPGTAIRVDRFVEHFFDIKRHTSTGGTAVSIDWAAGSGPPPERYVGWMPDALIPVDMAPAWAPWPMHIAAHQNGVVWIDLTIPPDMAPGMYSGEVRLRQSGGAALETLPLEIEVLSATMPARPIATMLFYDRADLRRRIGDGERAERQLWDLFHRHRVVPLHSVGSAEDVRAHLPALDGSAFTPAQGYTGPATGAGDDIVVLGTYGTLGDANAAQLGVVERIADELARQGVFDRADVVLYAEDEDCSSRRGAAWRDLIQKSPNPNVRRVRVTWTCSEDPAKQPVDVPIVIAGVYDTAAAADARDAGKQTWIYNGVRPATGSTLTDTEATSLRSFGWIAAMAGVPRWFLWQTTYWYDDNPGGHGAYDPFVTAETFHNREAEASMGGGVLVYPGRQVDAFGEHSLGFVGVIPSIRLKNLRRGIQDAGYLQLARGAWSEEATYIARKLMPQVLAEAQPGTPPSWGERGEPFFEARRRLALLIAPGADSGPDGAIGAQITPPPFRMRFRHRALALMLVAAAGGVLVVLQRGRGRRRVPVGSAGEPAAVGQNEPLMSRRTSRVRLIVISLALAGLAIALAPNRVINAVRRPLAAGRARHASPPAEAKPAAAPAKAAEINWSKPGLCAGLVHDKKPHPMTPLAKPAVGQVVTDAGVRHDHPAHHRGVAAGKRTRRPGFARCTRRCRPGTPTNRG